MHRFVRPAVVTATAAVMGISSAPTAHAIVGGYTVRNSSVVQFESNRYLCTATVVAKQWVMTARHCLYGAKQISIYSSNSVYYSGPPLAADRWYRSPNGDIALVHLKKPLTNARIMPLGNTVPGFGTRGAIYGYGEREGGRAATWLRKADVNVIGRSYDGYGGRAVHIRGVNGIDNHGDSGGPLVVNGRVVGVSSTGDTEPVVSTRASSNYASVASSRAWIRRVAGV